MSAIHYLREISRIKKRISLFSNELDGEEPASADYGNAADNRNTRYLMKILNELHAMKACSIVRCNQHFSQLFEKNRPLAKMFFIRSVKERMFLKKLKSELEKFGRSPEFRAAIHASPGNDENYPASVSEKILREQRAAHQIMEDCYSQLICDLKKILRK